jgi:ABC-2 type transport system ATP-binding protein
LVHNPRLIILDEPTNGLDPQGIADMRNLILQLSKKMGKTVVVSSHLLSEIEIVANRILIINNGKKVAEGNAADLLDPAKTIVRITTLNDAAALEQLNRSVWKDHMNSGQGISLTINKNDIPTLTADMVAMDIAVLSINPQHSLENYFLSLTNQPGHVETFSN